MPSSAVLSRRIPSRTDVTAMVPTTVAATKLRANALLNRGAGRARHRRRAPGGPGAGGGVRIAAAEVAAVSGPGVILGGVENLAGSLRIGLAAAAGTGVVAPRGLCARRSGRQRLVKVDGIEIGVIALVGGWLLQPPGPVFIGRVVIDGSRIRPCTAPSGPSGLAADGEAAGSAVAGGSGAGSAEAVSGGPALCGWASASGSAPTDSRLAGVAGVPVEIVEPQLRAFPSCVRLTGGWRSSRGPRQQRTSMPCPRRHRRMGPCRIPRGRNRGRRGGGSTSAAAVQRPGRSAKPRR